MSTAVSVDPTLRLEATEFTDALLDMVRVIQFRDRDRACCYGLSPSQCYGLKAICDGTCLSVNELAARLYLEKSTASRLVNSLEEMGFVVKEPDPEDRRILRIRASPRGEAIHRAIMEDLLSESVRMLEHLDGTSRRAVTGVVRGLASSYAAGVEASGGSCCVVR
ncbi:MAG: MarR family transcriptional regulator [Gemmatimonadetes bacterium]|nr:MarR family transcriptional regulator [Gemmatimonadota bacterium]